MVSELMSILGEDMYAESVSVKLSVREVRVLITAGVKFDVLLQCGYVSFPSGNFIRR